MQRSLDALYAQWRSQPAQHRDDVLEAMLGTNACLSDFQLASSLVDACAETRPAGETRAAFITRALTQYVLAGANMPRPAVGEVCDASACTCCGTTQLWALFGTLGAPLAPVRVQGRECARLKQLAARYNAALPGRRRKLVAALFVFFSPTEYCMRMPGVREPAEAETCPVPDTLPDDLEAYLQDLARAHTRPACLTPEALWATWRKTYLASRIASIRVLRSLPRAVALASVSKSTWTLLASPVCVPVPALPDSVLDAAVAATPWIQLHRRWMNACLGVATCPRHSRHLANVYATTQDSMRACWIRVCVVIVRHGFRSGDAWPWPCDFDTATGRCRVGYVDAMAPAPWAYLTASEERGLLQVASLGGRGDTRETNVNALPAPTTRLASMLRAAHPSIMHTCFNRLWNQARERPWGIPLWNIADVLPPEVVDRALATAAAALSASVRSMIRQTSCPTVQRGQQLGAAESRFRDGRADHPARELLFLDLCTSAVVAGGFVDSIVRHALGRIAAHNYTDIDVFVTDTYAEACKDAAVYNRDDFDGNEVRKRHCWRSSPCDGACNDSGDSELDEDGTVVFPSSGALHESPDPSPTISGRDIQAPLSLPNVPVQFISTQYTHVSALLAFMDFTHAQACIVANQEGALVIYASAGALLSWLSTCTVQAGVTRATRVQKAWVAKGYGAAVVVRAPDQVSDDLPDTADVSAAGPAALCGAPQADPARTDYACDVVYFNDHAVLPTSWFD